MRVSPLGFLRRVRELCDAHGVLLIADEVAVGFGRTGRMFACEHEQVSPDIMALAKGLTGGYLPLAATLTTEEVFEAFLGSHEEFRTLFHGHTYTGNQLACTAALASLRIFEEDRTLEHVNGLLPRFERELSKISQLPHVGDVRHRGLMAGIELVAERSEKTEYPPAKRIGQRVCEEARRRGLIIRPLSNVIVLMPPLAVTESELIEICTITRESIQKVTEETS